MLPAYSVIVLLMITFLLSQSSSATDVPRDLLSEAAAAAVQISPNDTESCCSDSGGCVQSSSLTSPWCAFDGNSSTEWILTPGQRKLTLTVNLRAQSLIDHFEVSFGASSVIPSSVVMNLTGSHVTWVTYGNKSCQISDRHLRRLGSVYYSCTPAGRLWNVSVPEGLFSVQNWSNGWLWWRTFNQLQLTIEATDADYNSQTENSSIAFADVLLYGWNEPTDVCNCHPVGVEDADVPCFVNRTCKCRRGARTDHCTPDIFDGKNATFGPISGGTKLSLQGNDKAQEYLQKIRRITIGNDYSCLLSQTNNTVTEIQTIGANASDLRSPLPIWFCWERTEGIKSCLITDSVFTYLPDPVVFSIFPRKTIEIGGITQTVLGMNLDSVSFPYITVYSVLQSATDNTPLVYNYTTKPYIYNPDDKKCDIVNSTMLTCRTMPLPGVQVTSDHRLFIGISLDIPLYNNYTTCYVADRKCDFTLVKIPSINRWSDDIMDYPVYQGRKPVYITGSGFLEGCAAHEYRVKVNGITCEILNVTDDRISFYPPSLTDPTKNQETVLYVGAYYSFTVGDLKYYTEPDRSALIGGLVGGIGGFILLIVVIILVVRCLKRKREEKDRKPTKSDYEPRYTRNPGEPFGPITEYLPRDVKEKVDKYTVPYNRIELVQEFGKGNFGKVFKGTLMDKAGIKQPVAIKSLYGGHHDIKDKVEFVEEAILMADFCHKHVLSLIAIVIEQEVPYVVLPLMELGDLRSFVSKDSNSFTVGNLVNFSLQVAEGMEYLASMKFVHRDLAARNCMINKNFLVKVADFGLARDIFEKDYYRPQDSQRPLPVKWMALECLSSNTAFTEKSDVWSYGVLLWELMTRGKQPYRSVDNLDLKQFLMEGNRLEKPPVAPDFIYDLMLRCWLPDRNDRPRFKDIIKKLKEILSAAEASNAPTRVSSAVSGQEMSVVVVVANDSYLQLSGNLQQSNEEKLHHL